jgi:Saxitoxin biosynthesis operon protein SxtJ
MTADFHESLRQEAIEGPSDRSFGLTVGGIFMALGAVRSLVRLEPDLASALMLAVGATLVCFAVFSPKSLGHANRLWMRLGALIARIVNPLILLLVYALAFVPIGFIMRARGHDPLRLRRAAPGASYWIPRSSSDSLVARMNKQF